MTGVVLAYAPPGGTTRCVIGEGPDEVLAALYDFEHSFVMRCIRAGASPAEAVAILERVREHPASLDTRGFESVAREELARWRATRAR